MSGSEVTIDVEKANAVLRQLGYTQREADMLLMGNLLGRVLCVIRGTAGINEFGFPERRSNDAGRRDFRGPEYWY